MFQAPGGMEWVVGKPIQPTKRLGGTAGVRIHNSWKRVGKSRDDFDILNAVQCFPGNNGGRDLPPMPDAKACCVRRLSVILEQGSYRKIIAFGDVAFEMIDSVTSASGMNCPCSIHAAHPNGGTSNSTLDSLW